MATISKRRLKSAIGDTTAVLLNVHEDLFQHAFFTICPIYAIAQAVHGSKSLNLILDDETYRLYLHQLHLTSWEKMGVDQAKKVKYAFTILVEAVKSAK